MRFKDFQAAEGDLFKYIEAYYNRRGKYSSNGYKSPNNFENQWKNFEKNYLTGTLQKRGRIMMYGRINDKLLGVQEDDV